MKNDYIWSTVKLNFEIYRPLFGKKKREKRQKDKKSKMLQKKRIKKRNPKICNIDKQKFQKQNYGKKPKLKKSFFLVFWSFQCQFSILSKAEKSSIIYSCRPFLYMRHNSIESATCQCQKESLNFEIQKSQLTRYNHLSQGFQKGKTILNVDTGSTLY